MGDNRDVWLIAILILISIKIQKILLSWMCSTSLVTHNKVYFATLGRSGVTEENWISSGSSDTTSTIDNKSHA